MVVSSLILVLNLASMPSTYLGVYVQHRLERESLIGFDKIVVERGQAKVVDSFRRTASDVEKRNSNFDYAGSGIISGEGSKIAVVNRGCLVILDTRSKKEVARLDQKVRVYAYAPYGSWSADEKRLLLKCTQAGEGAGWYLWTNNGKLRRVSSNLEERLFFLPNGAILGVILKSSQKKVDFTFFSARIGTGEHTLTWAHASPASIAQKWPTLRPLLSTKAAKAPWSWAPDLSAVVYHQETKSFEPNETLERFSVVRNGFPDQQLKFGEAPPQSFMGRNHDYLRFKEGDEDFMRVVERVDYRGTVIGSLRLPNRYSYVVPKG